MREKEAAALQAQLLQEQAAANGPWHEQQAAEPEPAVVPAAIRQPMQRVGQPQWQPDDVPAFAMQQQQQQQHAAHEQQLGWQHFWLPACIPGLMQHPGQCYSPALSLSAVMAAVVAGTAAVAVGAAAVVAGACLDRGRGAVLAG